MNVELEEVVYKMEEGKYEMEESKYGHIWSPPNGGGQIWVGGEQIWLIFLFD